MLKLLRTLMLALVLAGLPVQSVLAAMPFCLDDAPASMAHAADPDEHGTQPAGDDRCMPPYSDSASCHCCGISAPVSGPMTGAIRFSSTYPAPAPVRYHGFEPDLANPPPVL